MRKIVLSIYMIIGLAIIGFIISFLVKNQGGSANDSVNNTSNVNDSPNIVVASKKEQVSVDKPKRYIDRKTTVKLIGLLKEDKQAIMNREEELEVDDSVKEQWYYDYFNIAYTEKWLPVNNKNLLPDENLKYEELEKILEYFKVSSSEFKFDYGDQAEVEFSDFMTVYKGLIDRYDDEHTPKEKVVYIFQIEKDAVYTDKGKFYVRGVELNELRDHSAKVLCKEDEILYIENVYAQTPVLYGAYIENYDKGSDEMTIFMGGVSRKVKIGKNINKNIETTIANIQIVDNEVYSLEGVKSYKRGALKKISNELVEIAEEGIYRISEQCKIYNCVDTPKFTNIYDVLVGYNTAKYYLNDENEVVAIEIVEKVNMKNIRVAINTTGYNGLYHQDVRVTSSKSFTYDYNGKERKINGGNILEVSALNMQDGERIVIKGNAEFKVLNVKRGWGTPFNPEYRGDIEVEKTKEGYILVNEVDFEQYLYGVVPSEMPVSHGLEALKVQAICARSYAYTQFRSNSYCAYGAHVDDSTMSQVYNNSREQSVANKAVDATKGMVLSYDGNVVTTNFFSTSCGVTSNVGEVWANYRTKVFPTNTVEYLSYQFQNIGQPFDVNLKLEQGFKLFIDSPNLDTFDSPYNWYRWRVTMTKEQIAESIKASIKQRYEANPLMIKTAIGKDVYRSRTIEEIGEIEDINIYSRGESGIITGLEIHTKDKDYLILTEYNVRKLLAPKDLTGASPIVIVRKDDSTVKNMGLLPSAYFYMNKVYNESKELESVEFVGGGYGHGVGMSQNGVKTMVDKGYKYEEILKHYYTGTEIINMATK